MKYIAVLAAILVAGCTTPSTVLKNQETGQVVQCGGNVSSSLGGGIIGYHIQKGNDQDCVQMYQGEGFDIISQEQ